MPNCDLRNPAANGECAPDGQSDPRAEGLQADFDPDYVSGWGTRPDNWALGATVQQEIAPRVSVTVGYFRNWWGNWYVVDNRATSLADYTPFSILAPVDPRLPGGGGQMIDGLYNLVPDKVGPVDELAQSSENFGKQTENWHGVDFNVAARLRGGLTVQGARAPGAGSRTAATCGRSCRSSEPAPRDSRTVRHGERPGDNGRGSLSVTNPYCRIAEPFRTDFRGLATYTIPRVDVQVSGTWASIPGESLSANFVANNAWIAAGPQPLGRNLSGAANVTVNLIEPFTLFADRRNNIDFRVAKILRYGGTRADRASTSTT